MARYYLHLRDGIDELLDQDGVDLNDMAAIKKATLAAARDIMSGDVTSAGLLDLRHRIDVEDEKGNLVFTLPFIEAVAIIRDAE